MTKLALTWKGEKVLIRLPMVANGCHVTTRLHVIESFTCHLRIYAIWNFPLRFVQSRACCDTMEMEKPPPPPDLEDVYRSSSDGDGLRWTECACVPMLSLVARLTLVLICLDMY